MERAQPAPPQPACATLAALSAWVRSTLGEEFPVASNGLWQGDGTRPVRRLGVALRGTPEVAAAAARHGVDALLLHRPWGLEGLAPGVGVLVFHEALDERLTTGDNPWLAARLGFTLGEGIGERLGRPLVRLAHAVRPGSVGGLLAGLRAEFGGYQLWNPADPEREVTTIALANAMRPALLACAAHAGATVYVTGALRRGTWATLWNHNVMAVGLGHAPVERWGLRWLADALARHFALQIVWLDD